MKSFRLTAAVALLALGGCASNGAPAPGATPAVDQSKAAWYLQAAGCAVGGAGTAAQPQIGAQLDATGNLVLAVLTAAGNAECHTSVPASAVAPTS